jgi:transposase InsO family protein
MNPDPQQQRSLALARKKSHQKLMRQLATLPARKVDERFHSAHEEAFAEIDCLSCANCCRTTSPLFREADIRRLARHLRNGRSFRALNILDDYNRQALHVEIDTSLPALRVIRVLEMLRDTHGTLPKAIRTDNGPEFISQKLEDWCQKHHIQIQYIQPGKPTQNAYIERCNRTLREELLNA